MSDLAQLRQAAAILAGLPLGMAHHDYAIEAVMLLSARPPTTQALQAAARRITMVAKNLHPATGYRQLPADELDVLTQATAVAARIG